MYFNLKSDYIKRTTEEMVDNCSIPKIKEEHHQNNRTQTAPTSSLSADIENRI
jgi:ribosomal protein S17E